MSGKNERCLKCEVNVRAFYNFQFVSYDEKQKVSQCFGKRIVIL